MLDRFTAVKPALILLLSGAAAMITERMRSVLLVVGLVGLSGLMQAAILARAVMPELDAVRFIETAQTIEQHGFATALRASADQPLFPVLVWLAHAVLERTVGDFHTIWVLSAQVAAAIPLVLAIVPVYLLSVRLVGRMAALAGALLFCVLPEVSCLGAEGISDSTHLLFFCLAYWAVVVYLTGSESDGPLANVAPATRDHSFTPFLPSSPFIRPSPLWLLLAGLAVGLALLARVEVILLPLALVALLAIRRFTARDRQPWLPWIAALGCLTLGIVLPIGPYLLVVGATTPQAAVARVLGRYEPEEIPIPGSPSDPARPGLVGAAAWKLADGEPMSFAHKDPSIQVRRRGLGAVAKLCGEELADAFGYWVGPFALLGLWRLRRVLRRPVDAFDGLFLVAYSATVIWFAAREGYLCPRHLLAVVVVGIGCAGVGLLATGAWLGKQATRLIAGLSRAAPLPRLAGPWIAVAAAVVPCLMESAKPVNTVRRCHRQAAEWLAQEAPVPGHVVDTWGITGLFSGRKTYLFTEAPAVLGDPRLAYVVLEKRETEFPTRRSQTLRTLLEVAAEPAARFTSRLTVRGERTVIVYRWHADRFSQWLTARWPEKLGNSDPHAQARSSVSPECDRSL